MQGVVTMEEYLRWFDQEMKRQGKHALLLMDNFPAHEAAVEQFEDSLTVVGWNGWLRTKRMDGWSCTA